MSLFGSGLFDETDPLIVIRDLREELQEEKYKYNKLENFMYDVLTQKKTFKKQSEGKTHRINALENQMVTIHEVIGQR